MTGNLIDRALASGSLELLEPERIVDWSLAAGRDQRLSLGTGFGLEGCALIDMYARRGASIEVFYLDTGFFFPETYALRDDLTAHYPALQFVNRGTALAPEEQAARYGARLWETDPDRCCQIRKVEPLIAALAEVDLWVTGITRGQSLARRAIPVLGRDEPTETYKLCPLAAWDRQQVWDYVRRHDVPHNPLHRQGFPSIGCLQCTRAVADVEANGYSREGRWSGLAKTECGLHGVGVRSSC